MARLEDLTTGTRLTGLAASGTVTVESAQWIGEQCLRVIFRDSDGHLGERFVYRNDEPSVELVEMGRPWSFGDVLSKREGGDRGIDHTGLDPFFALGAEVFL